ncbi:MAG: anti-sigma factor, partial [Planctomycetota bacterium]|nr:anti-sigma factor [Planctomycetota bacterium]
FTLWPAGAGPDQDALRDELIAAGAKPLAWDVASEDPLAVGVTGDVLWSDADQVGVMRFEGLPVNDADELQYQLWIFDPTKPNWEDHPVDGGVFDVPVAGEVLVPIDPKIEVGQAALFAITAESPGGVVVSSRERLLVTAAVP